MDQAPSKARPLILVTDDDALLRYYAAAELARAGYETLEAGSAREALDLLRDRPDIRVLFTDIHMPGDLDGLELAEQVHQRWPNVLLLVTSGRARLQDGDVPDDGMFLRKPYEGERLTAAMKELFRKHPAGPKADGAGQER